MNTRTTLGPLYLAVPGGLPRPWDGAGPRPRRSVEARGADPPPSPWRRPGPELRPRAAPQGTLRHPLLLGGPAVPDGLRELQRGEGAVVRATGPAVGLVAHRARIPVHGHRGGGALGQGHGGHHGDAPVAVDGVEARGGRLGLVVVQAAPRGALERRRGRRASGSHLARHLHVLQGPGQGPAGPRGEGRVPKGAPHARLERRGRRGPLRVLRGRAARVVTGADSDD
mmetsp:Transcript_19121/g.64047  ORF Transcript_19121/g.64047 Transcript_19121/m.64047 type:complete len:226 (-) Transcript_19121:930-1607(-)